MKSDSLSDMFRRLIAKLWCDKALLKSYRDYSKVRCLVKAGADPNARTPDGLETALTLASSGGLTDTVSLLLEAGADPNTTRGYSRESVLSHACSAGFFPIAELLMAKGADPYKCGNALSHVLTEKTLSLAKLMLECRTDFSADREKSISNALPVAAGTGSKNLVEMLLSAGANVIADESDCGGNALIEASENGFAEIVRLLLEAGVDVNAEERNSGDTALIKASKNGFAEIVRLLLEAGADVRPVTKTFFWNGKSARQHGWNALYWAKNNAEIISLLKSAGARYHNLHCAAEYGDIKDVELILRDRPNMNERNDDGFTALHLAVKRGSTEIAQLLLDNGADINCGVFKWSSRSLEMAEFLLTKGVDINEKGYKGNTLLIETVHTIEKPDMKLMAFLLNHGADVNAQNDMGWTALITAIIYSHIEAVKLLLKTMNEKGINIKNDGGGIARAIAYHSNRQIEEMLIDAGADL